MSRDGRWGHRALTFIHALGRLVPLVLGAWKGQKHPDAQTGDSFLAHVSDSDGDLPVRTWDAQLHRRRVFGGIALLGMLDVRQSWGLNPSSFSKRRKRRLWDWKWPPQGHKFILWQRKDQYTDLLKSGLCSYFSSFISHFILPEALSSTSCEPCMPSTLLFLISTLLPVLFPIFGSPLSCFGEFQAVFGGSSDVFQPAFPDTPQWRSACPVPALYLCRLHLLL